LTNPKVGDYVLNTPRLKLRLIEVEDAESINHLHEDAEAARHVTFTPTGVAETAAILGRERARFENGESVLWAILDREDGAFIGVVDMMSMDDSEGEVAFIIERTYWGRGIVPEALAAVPAFSRERLGLRRVGGRCDVDNVRSARVFEKLAFCDAGIVRHARLAVGHSPT
jgi:ribosomal-protein-alanine N-acetyltransferase